MADLLPSWIHQLGTPTWVSDPTGKIAYINQRAERLLGLSSDVCLGRPCHQIVAGVDENGCPHCGPGCPTRREALRRGEIEPFDLSVLGPDGRRHWVQVLVIALPSRGGNRPWLVHCAAPRDRAHRIESYIRRIASRSESGRARPADTDVEELTQREKQILRLLTEDHDLYTIADELCISYATVRNHVQHILAKLRVHSIMEAVALDLSRGEH